MCRVTLDESVFPVKGKRFVLSLVRRGLKDIRVWGGEEFSSVFKEICAAPKRLGENRKNIADRKAIFCRSGMCAAPATLRLQLH